MGRHSAPDDDADVAAVAAPPRREGLSPHSRHASSDDADPDALTQVIDKPKPRPHGEDEAVAVAVTGRIPPLEAGPEPAPETVPAKKARKPRGGPQATSADLSLLREHSDVRARCIAAVIVPFVLYTVVMYLIGSARDYLIWVWIPLVTAGVLAGSFLDAAHRRHPRDDDA
jgi:hypothetical protein